MPSAGPRSAGLADDLLWCMGLLWSMWQLGVVWLVGKWVGSTPISERAEDPGGSAIRAQNPLRAVIAVVVLTLGGLLSTTSHTVRQGETLDGIARRHGTTVADLVARNGIRDPNRIFVGETLTVSSSGGPSSGAGTGGGGTYTVQRGDTLATIARRHGTTVRDLVARNGIRDPNLVIAGHTLQIPGSNGSTGSTGSVGPTAGTPAGHVVRAGETIAGIASRHGITPAQLVAANGLADGKVFAGQRLFLSAPNSVPSTEARGDATHTVAAGESLWTIARRHGTTVATITRANSLANPDRIRVGDRLVVPGGSGGGRISCPVPGAGFVNDWGFPRAGGRFHNGNDLFAPRGTPVRAPVSGTVTQATGQMGGNQVKLVGDDGNHWHGTHLDRFGASGRVSAGDVIGYVGNTGNAHGGPPHLHLELHPGGGAPVNPYPLLFAAC
jgi:LysM repeat protein